MRWNLNHFNLLQRSDPGEGATVSGEGAIRVIVASLIVVRVAEEERALRRVFGRAYVAYAQHVPTLIGVRRR